MQDLLKTTLLGLFFGMFGTSLGGIIGATLNINSKKIMSFILELAAGLMTAIICFELIPEALEITNITNSIIGLLFGVACMIVCDSAVNKKFKKANNNLLKTGLIVGIGLAIHNFPEGLAIGSGFGASIKLGYSLAIAIAFHDIPEGISMAVPMKNGGMSKAKAIIYTMISGVTTGIGAFFGGIFGREQFKDQQGKLRFATKCRVIRTVEAVRNGVEVPEDKLLPVQQNNDFFSPVSQDDDLPF